MHSNLFHAILVFRVICRHHDFSAIFEEFEVMSGLIVRKPHYMIPALRHLIVAIATILVQTKNEAKKQKHCDVFH